MAYSNSAIERYIDKYLFQPFRPRGKKTQELFECIQMKVEGTKASVAIVAKDFIRDVNKYS